MRRFLKLDFGFYFCITIALTPNCLGLAKKFCETHPKSEYCLEDFTSLKENELRYSQFAESVRKTTEKILTEQPDNPDLINQYTFVRGMPAQVTLLFVVLHQDFYDLANTILDNTYFTQDSLNMTLINSAQACAEGWENVLSCSKVLFDHGAKFIETLIYNPKRGYATSYIKDQTMLFMQDDQRKKLFYEYEYQGKQPTKKLFFSSEGKPVTKDKAKFFIPSKKDISSQSYKELDFFVSALKQIG